MAAKLKMMGVPDAMVEHRMSDFLEHGNYHIRAVQEVVDSQLDPSAAAQLNDAGGGAMVLAGVLAVLSDVLPRGPRRAMGMDARAAHKKDRP